MNILKKIKDITFQKQKNKFKCAQCEKTEMQYKSSIICKECAVSNKLYEAESILKENLEGKLLTAWYDEEIDEIRVKIED